MATLAGPTRRRARQQSHREGTVQVLELGVTGGAVDGALSRPSHNRTDLQPTGVRTPLLTCVALHRVHSPLHRRASKA